MLNINIQASLYSWVDWFKYYIVSNHEDKVANHEVVSPTYHVIGRVNLGKYRQGGKYGQMTYNSHVQEHRSVTQKCFISAYNSVHSSLLHPYTT